MYLLFTNKMIMYYWQFHSALEPYTTVRWWEFLTPATLLQTTINYAIQIIYNKTRWDFNFTSIVIDSSKWEKVETWTDEVSYYIYNLEDGDIPYLLDEATWLRWSTKTKWYQEIKSISELWDKDSANKWMQWGNSIIIREPETVTLSFYKGYIFLDYNAEHISRQVIPLPESFMPSLDFLCKSNIDQIAVNTANGEQIDNYTKYQSQIRDLLKKNKGNVWGIISNIN